MSQTLGYSFKGNAILQQHGGMRMPQAVGTAAAEVILAPGVEVVELRRIDGHAGNLYTQTKPSEL